MNENESPQVTATTLRRGRSPFFSLGCLVFGVLLVGWGVASWRPWSFGWLGNPRVDGYLAMGCLVVDTTTEPGSWSIGESMAVPLLDESDFDMLGYREETGWFKLVIEPVEDVPGGRHFLVGFPLLIAAQLLGCLGVELAWGSWRRKVASRHGA